MLDALMPTGAIWRPKENGYFDKLLDGFSSCFDFIKTFLDTLSEIRNPETTTMLSDLEREYGKSVNANLTEETRRMQLAAQKYSKLRNGSIDHLQSELDAAGFDVLVHENSPAVDPAIFLDQAFQMVADGDNAYAGHIPLGGPPSDAFAGRLGGELLVNGAQIFLSAAYLMQAGGTFGYAGLDDAVAGRYDYFTQSLFQYDIPTDPNDWPLVFFVGGAATRDGTGALTDIQTGFVPSTKEGEFKNIILKAKPAHSWAGLIITFT
jgi:uncharacterized protein YmfQ (DUF2313 family)